MKVWSIRALALCCGLATLLCSVHKPLYGDGVATYYDRTAWQNAITLGGQNALTTISLDSANWAESIVSIPFPAREDDGIALSHASDGMTVIIDHENSESGVPSIPSFSSDSLTGILDKHDVYTWTFGEPIYAFGADFIMSGDGNVYMYGNAGMLQTGFVGIITADPISSLFFYPFDCQPNPLPFNCYSEFTMTNVAVSTTPTPEPAYPLLLGLLLAGVSGCRKYRLSRAVAP